MLGSLDQKQIEHVLGSGTVGRYCRSAMGSGLSAGSAGNGEEVSYRIRLAGRAGRFEKR